MFCLWFKNNKVCNLQQLTEFFDFDIAEMYLLGGSLTVWLEQCGESDLAQRVKDMDLNGDISLQLSEIFNVKLPDDARRIMSVKQEANHYEKNEHSVSEQKKQSLASFAEADIDFNKLTQSSFENKALESSFATEKLSSFVSAETGSFVISSFELSLTESSFGAFNTSFFELNKENSFFSQSLSSFERRSFNFETVGAIGSFLFSSFNSGSFGGYEYEYEYEYGSSFSISSFNTSSFTVGFFNTGSFTVNSFNAGSFSMNSFNAAALPLQSDIPENAENDLNVAKEPEKIFLPKKADDLPPEEKIKQNILSCPLNRFGYGINLI